MTPRTTAILVTVGLSAIGVLADYFLKMASSQNSMMKNPWFGLGLLTYSLTAFGWVYVLKNLDLSHVGVFYSSATLLFLVIVGIFVFDEKLKPTEILGVSMALGSILLLARVA